MQPGYVFSTPITLTVEYSDDDVTDIPQGEESLELYYWDGDEGEWGGDGITVVSISSCRLTSGTQTIIGWWSRLST